jgi:hypothetical protein
MRAIYPSERANFRALYPAFPLSPSRHRFTQDKIGSRCGPTPRVTFSNEHSPTKIPRYGLRALFSELTRDALLPPSLAMQGIFSCKLTLRKLDMPQSKRPDALKWSLLRPSKV